MFAGGFFGGRRILSGSLDKMLYNILYSNANAVSMRSLFQTGSTRGVHIRPLIFPAAAIFIILSFFISRKIKGGCRSIVYSCMALVVWASVLNQFIHIAQYIDASGERIADILGPSGLALSWTGLIATTLLMMLLLFEAIKGLRRGGRNDK